MDDPDRWLQSDSEEEEGADFDPYQCDPEFEIEKSRIWETLNLSACADSSTDTKHYCIIGSKVTKVQSFKYKGKKLHIYKVTKLQSYTVSNITIYQVTKLLSYKVIKQPIFKVTK